MKVYEYYCDSCDKVFEKTFEFAKNPKTVSCECGKDASVYFGGGFRFILKGSGWPGKTVALNNEMNRKQDAAAKKQEGTWRSEVPKLVDQR